MSFHVLAIDITTDDLSPMTGTGDGEFDRSSLPLLQLENLDANERALIVGGKLEACWCELTAKLKSSLRESLVSQPLRTLQNDAESSETMTPLGPMLHVSPAYCRLHPDGSILQAEAEAQDELERVNEEVQDLEEEAAEYRQVH